MAASRGGGATPPALSNVEKGKKGKRKIRNKDGDSESAEDEESTRKRLCTTAPRDAEAVMWTGEKRKKGNKKQAKKGSRQHKYLEANDDTVEAESEVEEEGKAPRDAEVVLLKGEKRTKRDSKHKVLEEKAKKLDQKHKYLEAEDEDGEEWKAAHDAEVTPSKGEKRKRGDKKHKCLEGKAKKGDREQKNMEPEDEKVEAEVQRGDECDVDNRGDGFDVEGEGDGCGVEGEGGEVQEAEDEGCEQPKVRKCSMQKRLFIYGNYHHYYGYRIGRNVEEDPRLSVFRKEWFERKDCLDIGCNEGIVTINIALKFQCRSICGIDIDQSLIDTAYWNLRKTLRLLNSSCEKNMQMIQPQPLRKLRKAKTDMSKDLSKVVSFECANFLERNSKDFLETYDTVICLSVTKWVHLNWGDDGLIKLFVDIWKILKPGGMLLLEPQPWSSYRRNRKVSEASRVNYWSSFLRPDKFRNVLLDKVGFKFVDVITDHLSGTVAGFNRPIMAFYK